MGSLCHMYHFCFKPQKPLFQGILLLGQFFCNFFVAPLTYTWATQRTTYQQKIKLPLYSMHIFDCTQNFIANDCPLFSLKARYTHTTKFMSQIKI